MPYKNPEKKREWSRKRKPENPEVKRRNDLKRRYGITSQDFDKFWEAQGGRCNICRQPFKTPSKAHVDHYHEVNTLRNDSLVRGLLCPSCNTKVVYKADKLGPVFLSNVANHMTGGWRGGPDGVYVSMLNWTPDELKDLPIQ
jgi:DNA-directed RNA polymerase subunit RPC12/RpoP